MNAQKWALAMVLVGLFPFIGMANVIVWTNTAGGNWNTVANWNPNQLPTAADDVFITNNGTYSVALNIASTNGTLTLGGTSGIQTLSISGQTLTLNGPSVSSGNAVLNFSAGTIGGNGSLTVAGQFNWTGGTIGSAGSGFVMTLDGTTSIGTPNSKFFSGGTLINGGSCVWTAGQINFNNNAVFSNAPSGLFDVQGDGNVFVLNTGSGQAVLNAGTFRKSAGTGTSTISVPFNNSSAVQGNTGTLALTLTNSDGEFTAGTNGTLSVKGNATLADTATIDGPGNFTVSAGNITDNGAFSVQGTNSFSGGIAVFTGNFDVTNGWLVVSGATVTFNGSGTIAPAGVNISSGTLQGSMPVIFSGPSTWSGGTIGSAGSSLVVMANGGLTLSGGSKNFSGGTLVNGGQCAWLAGAVNFNNNAVLSNAPGGTIDIQGDGNVFVVNLGLGQLMVNAGTLLKSAGTGTSTLTIPVANSGTVQANSGTLALLLTDSDGEFTAGNNATLSVKGTAVLSQLASIDGPGNLTVTSGNITNNGALLVQGTNSFSGGTTVFAGSCQLTNTLSVTGGTVSFNGTGTVAPALLTMSGGTLAGTMPVNVNGLFTWNGGTIGDSASSLVVLANGGMNMGVGNKAITSSTVVNTGPGVWTGGQITFNNNAVFSNAPGATFDIQADGNVFAANLGTGQTALNAGTFLKSAGTGTSSISVPMYNSGTLEANNGTISITSGFLQTSGLTTLNGGNLSFGNQTAQLSGGMLGGSGTVTGSISNNAVLSPGGSPGLLSITANYTQTANGELQIELGGTAPVSGYDQLSVGGSARLAGTLSISYLGGFTPTTGNVFTNILYGTHSGGFSVIQAPTNNLSTFYNSKNMLVEPGNASPIAQLTVGLAQTAGHSFLVSGSGVDPDGTVTNLAIFQDTNLLVSVAGSSASVTVNTDFPGALNFTAQATDNKGAQGLANATVVVGTLPLLTLDPIGFQTNHAFKLLMLGEEGVDYQVLATNNLDSAAWPVLGVMQNTNGIWRFFDTNVPVSGTRFYRAKQLP